MASNRTVELNYAPPGYTEPTNELPPDYSTGNTYTIGGQELDAPLVNVSYLKAHLYLLRAINNLKATIEEGKDSRIPQDARQLHPPQRWAWLQVSP